MTTEEKKHTLHQQVNDENYTFDSSDFGCCLIININKTMKTIGGGHSIQKFRTGAEAEVKELQDVFGKPIYDTKVIQGKNGTNCVIQDVEEYISKNCGYFKACKIFVCVVLAFGGQGFFYDITGNKIPLSRVVRKFQSRAALRLKPKLFVVQLCDIDLQHVGKHLFAEVDGRSHQLSPLWPREADVLIYESNISGEYNWHPNLIKHNAEEIPGTSALRPCTFIKYFCNTLKSLQNKIDSIEKKKKTEEGKKESKDANEKDSKADGQNDATAEGRHNPKQKKKKEFLNDEAKNNPKTGEKNNPKEELQNYFEFNEVILRTNSKLATFIKDRNNWDLIDGTWSIIPRVPVVTDQLVKYLYPPRFYPPEPEKKGM
ncbi:uncharacterized protein LOC134243803 [Saccostrea cucullata]|uniref:uncharacterized protein LOC134243803 n=1 Tax=Saccostrea cuccullata TaxID=36930 RepID=UPI002ED39619